MKKLLTILLVGAMLLGLAVDFFDYRRNTVIFIRHKQVLLCIISKYIIL